MTSLTSTVYRIVKIGSKRYALGLHPSEPETLLSLRPIGRRVPYVVTISRVRVEAALAFGRSEQAAKRAARKAGVKWQRARKTFLATLLPPHVPQRRK